MYRIKPENIVGKDADGNNVSRPGFRAINLARPDFRYADLGGASLRKANLSGTILDGANLSGVFLGQVDISKSFFDAIDTTGAGKAEDFRYGFYYGEAFIDAQNLPRTGVPENLNQEQWQIQSLSSGRRDVRK
ncbi:pentapeptide repeat-containing protein [Enterobacter ludwigii]|uniref:pentapeptide repeat-containing protein n=1 Tax=Enterobacter ludwigii TaxID=299767 RepID=UPI003974C90D